MKVVSMNQSDSSVKKDGRRADAGKKELTETGTAWAWSAQGVSNGMFMVCIGYLTYYCTNVMHMSPAVIGTLLLTAKLFDIAADFAACVLIERTRSRMGKGRPYMLALPAAWTFLTIMFSAPRMGQTGSILYVFFLYFLANSVCNTLFQSAQPVYMARAIRPEHKTRVLSVCGLLTGIGGIAATVAFPLLVTFLGDTRGGWTQIGLCFAVPGILLSMVRILLIREKEEAPDMRSGAFRFRDIGGVLRKNPHACLLALIQIMASFVTGLNSAVTTYYFQYIAGSIRLQAAVGAVSVIGMISMAFLPAVTKRISQKAVFFICFIMGIFGNVLRTLPVLPLLIFSGILTSFAVIPTTALLPGMLVDCMDYHERKTGSRVEALFGSMNSFSLKIGTGLASVLTGFLMGAAGFDGAAAIQSRAAEMSIVALFSWIPAAAYLIMMFCIKHYNLPGNENPQRDSVKQNHIRSEPERCKQKAE